MTDAINPADPDNHVDGLPEGQQWPAAARTTLTRTLTDQISRVGVRAGQRVLDLTGDADRRYVTGVVGPHGGLVTVHTRTGAAHYPAEPGGFDVVLAERPDRDDTLALLTALLRPGGWLILASIIDVPPVIYSAPEQAASVVETVVLAVNHLAAAPAVPRSADDTARLLIGLGMDHVCAATLTETSRGGGPGCTRYRHRAQHLREQLINAGLTTSDLDNFDSAMRDPRVVLRLNHSVAVHAQLTHA
ncbi:hypothetical protein [Micromonospora sp. NPDC005324]|uniref:hypothetical protein n=1 Tax=Micromonospora sp. NPDC005324 TaxID=3157033 RepID=UPI0033B4AB09